MISIQKAFQNLNEEDFKFLLDTPIWLSLMAAYTADGKVSKHEKAEAVKLAHLRTFTAAKSLREYYAKVEDHFAERFDKLDSRLPKDEHDRDLYLRTQLKRLPEVLKKLDSDIMQSMEESLESFYEHIFKADVSFFQYFALPIISNRLDKSSKFDIDEDLK